MINIKIVLVQKFYLKQIYHLSKKNKKKKMAGYEEFQKFKNSYFMDEEELKLANNYVCFQLNNPAIGYKYFHDMYSYITKCFVVLNYRTKNSIWSG